VNSNAIYTSPGLVLFVRDSALMALPFDAGRLEAKGDPFPVAEPTDWDTNNSKGAFTISETGALAYFAGTGTQSWQLSWLDRAGKAVGALATRGAAARPVLSPDSGTVAIDFRDGSSGRWDIWLLGLARGTTTKFTVNGGDSRYPVWSPDGSQIAYSARRDTNYVLARKPANGLGTEEVLLTSQAGPVPDCWSQDGKTLIFEQMTDAGRVGIWTLPLTGEHKASVFDPAGSQGRLSPDMRWMAYVSPESGRPEIFVESFPAKTAKFQVSNSGGYRPEWSRDGKELFYVALDRKFMAVDVKTGERFEAGVPKTLFMSALLPGMDYSVSLDGKRFLMPSSSQETAAGLPLTVVMGWTSELRK
jgi:Tol biopolymer transport system component